jgi:proline iminopeptidase
MQRFASYDGTMLAYHTVGESERPLVCVPGGPGRDADYLGDLGGLSGLVMLHNRGTGGSDRPVDRDSYRADRLAEDLEALRVHLGLSRMDVLGHSAGAGVAMIYAARYPRHVASLTLVTPGLRAAGFTLSAGQWLENVQIRRDEHWFEQAYAAAADDGPREAYVQFMYGRWDEAAQAHSGVGQRHQEAADGYLATDWEAVAGSTSEGLAALPAPVLVIAGELDPGPTPAMAARLVKMVSHGHLVIQPKAGHFPWIDDPLAFAEAIRHLPGR